MLGLLKVTSRSSRVTSSHIQQKSRCHTPQDSPASVRPAYSGSSLLSSAQEKGTAAIISLHLPLPASCPSISLVFTPVVWAPAMEPPGEHIKNADCTPRLSDSHGQGCPGSCFPQAPGFSVTQPRPQAAGLKLGELVIRGGLWVRRPGLKPNPTSSLLGNPEKVVFPLCALAPPQSACLSGSLQA